MSTAPAAEASAPTERLLQRVLLQEGICSSLTEAEALAECILLEAEIKQRDDHTGSVPVASAGDVKDPDLAARVTNIDPCTRYIQSALQNVLDVSMMDAQMILKKCGLDKHEGRNESMDKYRDEMLPSSHSQRDPIDNDNDDDDNHHDFDEYNEHDDTKDIVDEPGEFIRSGECELCERDETLVKLTRHHLIPRAVWSRVEIKLLNAIKIAKAAINHSNAKDKDGTSSFQTDILSRARMVSGDGLFHLILDAINDTSTHGSSHSSSSQRNNILQDENERTLVRRALNQTCVVCRQCHRAIHRTHDNLTLALHFNTVERLLQDSDIYKFARWASKQKRGAGK